MKPSERKKAKQQWPVVHRQLGVIGEEEERVDRMQNKEGEEGFELAPNMPKLPMKRVL